LASQFLRRRHRAILFHNEVIRIHDRIPVFSERTHVFLCDHRGVDFDNSSSLGEHRGVLPTSLRCSLR
jgi:hypothetical protein